VYCVGSGTGHQCHRVPCELSRLRQGCVHRKQPATSNPQQPHRNGSRQCLHRQTPSQQGLHWRGGRQRQLRCGYKLTNAFPVSRLDREPSGASSPHLARPAFTLAVVMWMPSENVTPQARAEYWRLPGTLARYSLGQAPEGAATEELNLRFALWPRSPC
jgi:hypothetical protein